MSNVNKTMSKELMREVKAYFHIPLKSVPVNEILNKLLVNYISSKSDRNRTEDLSIANL